MRLGNCQFDEEKREKCEDGGLDEADEHFEHHDRHGRDVGQEEGNDEDEHFAGKDIAKKTEGEGDDARNFRKKFHNADKKSDDPVPEVDELASVFNDTDGNGTGNLDNEERHNGEHERHVEVGVYTSQKRQEFPAP